MNVDPDAAVASLLGELRAFRADWIEQANCRGVDPELFFPARGEPTRDAKALCKGCVVREECLDYALAHGERWGIWGGTTERDRRRLRRSLRQRAA
ncbi:MAG: WhiB family transcriptional regulator [Actinomycetota bacterium]|nr:WhiB family transcriptional regulator [Actinomycetota bacterium]